MLGLILEGNGKSCFDSDKVCTQEGRDYRGGKARYMIVGILMSFLGGHRRAGKFFVVSPALRYADIVSLRIDHEI